MTRTPKLPHLNAAAVVVLMALLLAGALGYRCAIQLPATWTERNTAVDINFGTMFAGCTVDEAGPADNGTLTITDCTVNYQPSQDFVGTDEFFVELTAGDGTSELLRKPVVVRVPFPLPACDFSPYQDGSVCCPPVSSAKVNERVGITAAYCDRIRFYGMSDDLMVGVLRARRLGLEVAGTSWIYPPTPTPSPSASSELCPNQSEVERLIGMANSGYVDLLVVGNERLEAVGKQTLTDCIEHVQEKVQSAEQQVTTSEEDEDLLLYPQLVEASDLAFPNIHPFNRGYAVDNAADYVFQRWEQLSATFAPKKVVVSEVGWRSDGNSKCHAVPSEANLKKFLGEMISCAESQGFEFYHFQVADEPWKGDDDNWGIFDSHWQLKDEFGEIFDQQPSANACSGTDFANGEASIEISVTPPCSALATCGDADFCDEWVEGIVNAVGPAGGNTHDYKVLVYLKVAGVYYLKPWERDPVTHILPDQTFRAHVCKLPTDNEPTDVTVLLIQKDYLFDPPPSFNPSGQPPGWLPGELAGRVIARDDEVLACGGNGG